MVIFFGVFWRLDVSIRVEVMLMFFWRYFYGSGVFEVRIKFIVV